MLTIYYSMSTIVDSSLKPGLSLYSQALTRFVSDPDFAPPN